MENNYIIRNASTKDIDGIIRLENQYGLEVYSKDSIEAMFHYDYYRTYVICIDDIIIGYISATIIVDECNLLKIIVDENYRKQGIGKVLFEHLINECKSAGVKSIYLEVRKDNLVAKRFYDKLGFVKESERLAYYDGVDAEILWYYIND